jgi:hypothetical protein
MADKSFGVKDINLIGASGTPEIESPNNLNIKATNVAISTDMSIGGELTVTDTFLKPQAVGLGTTNAAGRDAGISTATGTVIYDPVVGMQVYAGSVGGWKTIADTADTAAITPITATGGTKTPDGLYTVHTFLSSQNFEVTSGSADCDVFVVGGGGGGASGSPNGGYGGGGGGGGGIAYKSGLTIGPGTYEIITGGGGSGGTNNTGGGNATNGVDSTFDAPGVGPFPFVGKGGGAGRNNQTNGADGGSGGGGGSAPGSPNGQGGASSGNSVPAGGSTYGNVGGAGVNPGGDPYMGGSGGGAGGAGNPGGNSGDWPAGDSAKGAIGIGVPTISWIPTSVGDSGYFGGGGSGGAWSDTGPGNTPFSIDAAAGGGGNGRGGSPTGTNTAGDTNTGGGGAGGQSGPQAGTDGGSGIVIIRYLT